MDNFNPNGQNQYSNPSNLGSVNPTPAPVSAHGHKWLYTILVIIIVIILAVLGYYFSGKPRNTVLDNLGQDILKYNATSQTSILNKGAESQAMKSATSPGKTSIIPEQDLNKALQSATAKQ